ncbi:hypothetical protein V1Y59_06010 [Gordonia sp. PKS22-38]|uniref:Uncharacterized protein n=1 Tax=Gordonia prachuapensis TaxID=3115651 RepID=A0ABU7MQM5_9ACTN|nr:hypothetical protein [Gordonia sp. PKS22-38]
MLENLNKAAKKAGLHVAATTNNGRYSIRKANTAALIAMDVDASEAASIIAAHS